MRGQLASDEMAYDIRQYIDYLKHNPFWVGRREMWITRRYEIFGGEGGYVCGDDQDEYDERVANSEF